MVNDNILERGFFSLDSNSDLVALWSCLASCICLLCITSTVGQRYRHLYPFILDRKPLLLDTSITSKSRSRTHTQIAVDHQLRTQRWAHSWWSTVMSHHCCTCPKHPYGFCCWVFSFHLNVNHWQSFFICVILYAPWFTLVTVFLFLSVLDGFISEMKGWGISRAGFAFSFPATLELHSVVDCVFVKWPFAPITPNVVYSANVDVAVTIVLL